ncbi:hypothetical protein BLA27_19870 [Brucella cytisi]|uniref:Uncharacterized protein n=1 Tax=Brucella cytisi TaxID=407152 RepID=A0A1J6HUH9_9HYPH|nr:hypothetical protein BLA27_19870 [Brucella cytisi]
MLSGSMNLSEHPDSRNGSHAASSGLELKRLDQGPAKTFAMSRTGQRILIHFMARSQQVCPAEPMHQWWNTHR